MSRTASKSDPCFLYNIIPYDELRFPWLSRSVFLPCLVCCFGGVICMNLFPIWSFGLVWVFSLSFVIVFCLGFTCSVFCVVAPLTVRQPTEYYSGVTLVGLR
eukprot:gnl/Chilomastix_caulleri/7902.p2 GENE.gnl/Chilomastix_caulleri/7902~~gnl/Chilomastix_caulleri/7902.p2  ORF type:complete len:102 (+),score=7.65 gnl/Chilomastix_caulleri/7902:232-537(+)